MEHRESMVVYFKKGIFMNGGSISWKRLFIVQSALVLGACGGGGSSDQASSCVSGIAGLCSILNPGGSNTPAGAAAISTLFTTAPSKITLASGGTANYTIGGGTAPYTATSGNTAVVSATASGTNLAISSRSAGLVPVAVVDATGKTVTIDVTVLGKGQTGIPPSIFPASLKTSDCTTNIPFIFTGGTAPYTVLSSDNVVVPVSVAQPFGPDNYFLASIRSLFLVPDVIDPQTGQKKVFVPRIETVTVLDSQSQVATATISVEFAHETCADNPLLQTSPASANAHVTEVLAFQITGGQAPFTVTSTDANIVKVPVGNLPAPTFNAQATPSNRTTQATALLTITSADGQKANIRFTVLP